MNPPESASEPAMPVAQSAEELVYRVLTHLADPLNIPMERADLELGDVESRELDDLLTIGGRQIGIFVKDTDFEGTEDILGLVRAGFPVVLFDDDGGAIVVSRLVGRRIEITSVRNGEETSYITRRQLNKLIRDQWSASGYVAKKELECDASGRGHGGTSNQHHDDHHGDDHHDMPPLRRFLQLLRLDARDISMVLLYAVVAGILALATPLAIESLVNVVSWGTYLQPLLVLSFMLMAALSLAGILKILQTVVVEIIQRRQFVRVVGDLSHRFPRANQQALQKYYPRELANRVFDVLTIQKATATLLLDGISIFLTTTLGLFLLAFYHPFLLGFDLVLMLTMVLMIYLLGRGGIRTAIDESITKYRVAHWLQDVIDAPAAFKVNGGELLAIDRANRLTSEYLTARKRQFAVVLRQVAFAVSLQVIAMTALLGLGGWLVIRQQLTLGQLVASELVVAVVVGAFAKAGKLIEVFYDLMAGMDKVGHLLDIPVDERHPAPPQLHGPADLRIHELTFNRATRNTHVPSFSIAAGKTVAIVGDDSVGKSLLAQSLAGLVAPAHGSIEIAGVEAKHSAFAGNGFAVGFAGECEIFHGTLAENIDLARPEIGQYRVREVLKAVKLWERVMALAHGPQTALQTGGFPLHHPETAQLLIARAMAGKPHLLIIDGLLDDLSPETRQYIWDSLAAPDRPWTLVVNTARRDLADLCDEQLAVRLT